MAVPDSPGQPCPAPAASLEGSLREPRSGPTSQTVLNRVRVLNRVSGAKAGASPGVAQPRDPAY